MFTKNDFIVYFDQISNAERKVLKEIDGLLDLIKGDAITVPLAEIKNDAARHLQLLENAVKIINETAQIADGPDKPGNASFHAGSGARDRAAPRRSGIVTGGETIPLTLPGGVPVRFG